jgi:hypothetical protein
MRDRHEQRHHDRQRRAEREGGGRVSAACSGRAFDRSVMPSSSRACAPGRHAR